MSDYGKLVDIKNIVGVPEGMMGLDRGVPESPVARGGSPNSTPVKVHKTSERLPDTSSNDPLVYVDYHNKSDLLGDPKRRSENLFPPAVTKTKATAAKRFAENECTKKPTKVDCPERIIFCVDVSSEMSNKSFKAKAGSPFAPLDILKFAIKIFAHNKSQMNERHQYALVLLLDRALWVKDFTNDLEDFLKHTDEMSCLKTYDSFDATSLFDVILEKVSFPKADCLPSEGPPYIVRTILVYGRSHCPLQWTNHESQNLVSCSPFFFVDALYIHLPPASDNQCETIYSEICDLDEHGLSYMYEVSKSPTKVLNCMAHLLAHPLQRPLQEDSQCRLSQEEPAPAEGSYSGAPSTGW